jgi:hypothetical protein
MHTYKFAAKESWLPHASNRPNIKESSGEYYQWSCRKEVKNVGWRRLHYGHCSMSPATIRTSTFTHRRTHRHTHIQAHTSTLKHTTTDTHIRSHCSMSLTAIRTLNIQSLNCHLAPCTMTAATRSQSFEFWYKSHRGHAHMIFLSTSLSSSDISHTGSMHTWYF